MMWEQALGSWDVAMKDALLYLSHAHAHLVGHEGVFITVVTGTVIYPCLRNKPGPLYKGGKEGLS